jgi:hypothetical protein
MSQTRRKMLGASLLSAFGLMSETAVVRAAAANSEEDCKRDIPIFVRPRGGRPILLVPGDDHKVRAYDIKAKGGARIPKPPFDTQELIGNPKFELKPIESRVVKVEGTTLHIKEGMLETSLVKLDVSPMRWSEIPPHPPHRR